MRFDGKVAIVTGGASGIGLATVKQLLAEGAKVMVADYTDKLRDVLVSLKHPNVLGIRVDVSKENEVKALIDQTVKHFGTIDFVFSNAGVSSSTAATEETSNEWDRVMGINLKGEFLVDKYALEVMLSQKKKGAIVNMTSILGLVGNPQSVTYCATKGGVIAMTRSMAIRYAKDGIRVNAIAPGYVETPILNGLTSEMRVVLENAHPIGRLGQPEEIARAVCFLLSEEASFITGVVLPVDGGYTCI